MLCMKLAGMSSSWGAVFSLWVGGGDWRGPVHYSLENEMVKLRLLGERKFIVCGKEMHISYMYGSWNSWLMVAFLIPWWIGGVNTWVMNDHTCMGVVWNFITTINLVWCMKINWIGPMWLLALGIHLTIWFKEFLCFHLKSINIGVSIWNIEWERK